MIWSAPDVLDAMLGYALKEMAGEGLTAEEVLKRLREIEDAFWIEGDPEPEMPMIVPRPPAQPAAEEDPDLPF